MPEKQFVRAKPLKEAKEKNEHHRPRQNKKNYVKKYEEKNTTKDTKEKEMKINEVVKFMISTFRTCQISSKVKQLLIKFPQFFRQESKPPENQLKNNFNDCLWVGQRRDQPKQFKAISSDSSDPDWDSGSDKEVKLGSKKIGDDIIKKVNENMPRIIKKPGQLQRHERQFLEDYYMEKKDENKQIEEKQNENFANITPQTPAKQPVKQIDEKQEVKEEVENKFVWNEYNPQVNALIDGGFLTKIQNDDENYGGNIAFDEDDFSFESEKSSDSPSSSSSDDMFTDEGPRTTKIILKKTESEIQKEQPKGIVKIANHFFTILAEKLSLEAASCIWVISNSKGDQFKVTTKYMNEYYETANLNVDFPYISVNHSQFVHFKDIGTEKAKEILKIKYRKKKQYPQQRRRQNHYRQKK